MREKELKSYLDRIKKQMDNIAKKKGTGDYLLLKDYLKQLYYQAMGAISYECLNIDEIYEEEYDNYSKDITIKYLNVKSILDELEE